MHHRITQLVNSTALAEAKKRKVKNLKWHNQEPLLLTAPINKLSSEEKPEMYLLKQTQEEVFELFLDKKL